jgi:4-amino-4-deoxy-L-arabinose transferase-like glycosyltransferase
MQPRTRRISWLGLLLLTLASFALRLYLLDGQSLWYDEGVTVEVARRGIAELTRWTADDIQPPLYYYVVALWGNVAGWSEWSLRYPSVFFGTLTVPLLAVVTIALTRRRIAGLLAASLAAFHPLLLYYSQEARMYSMLTALGVLLAYWVIQGEATTRRRTLHWAIYIVVATAAVYTHYFAFFLLFALAAAYFTDQLFILPRLRILPPDDEADLPSTISRRPILGFVIANLIVLALYIPWITTLVTRLSVDTSYWQGELKLEEAIRHVAISFTSGETVLEREATQLLWVYGALTLISVAALLVRRAVQPRTILYALLWLLLPIAAILLLASITPKFNSRYVMIALPGLLLLWAAGLASLIRLRGWAWADVLRTPFVRLPALVALLAMLLLYAGFFYANRNWFEEPAFTKSEWRELSQYVRWRIGKDGNRDSTLIALVSGHAWPVWNYYAPDLPAVRFPELEILDVNAVLDYDDVAGRLHDAIQGHDNVWLIQWQARIVDPMGIVPLQLELAGKEEEVDVELWQVRLRHFREVSADRVLTRPITLNRRSVNFGNLIYLLDYEVAANGDLLLYWQLHPDHPTPLPDLQIVGETFTGDGLPFARIDDRRPVGYDFPPLRWHKDQINVGRIPATEWAGPGAMAGPYRARLSVYDTLGDLSGINIIGSQGQPVGAQATLDLDLPIAVEGPDIDPVALNFVELLPNMFMQVALLANQAEPGQAFAAQFEWYAERDLVEDVDLRLRWRLQSTGEILGERTVRISPGLPTTQWPDDELFHNLLQVRTPLDLPAGIYWLEIGVTTPESLFVRLPFRITNSSRLFNPPSYQTPVDETFGTGLRLLGILEPLQSNPRPGQQVALTLVWQASERIRTDYTTSVQWLDSEGKLAAQADLPLPGGSSNWLPNQVELQTIFVTVPDLTGDYRLAAAVYDANTTDFPRLLTPDGRDLVDLGVITVQP